MATSLHKIVTGYLLKKRYPIHFYIEFLTYCAAGLRELQFDIIGNVKYSRLPINSYGAITRPNGYMDWVAVCVPNGQYLRPLAQRTGMSKLNIFDDNGVKQPYMSDGDVSTSNFGIGVNNYYGLGFGVHYNNMLENVGRYYGNRGAMNNSFTDCPERNEIQINVDINATEIVLKWIGDGSSCDNATEIIPYAIETLEEYMEWQHRKNNRSYGDSSADYQKRLFGTARTTLRGRVDTMSKADFLSILNKNTHGSIK